MSQYVATRVMIAGDGTNICITSWHGMHASVQLTLHRRQSPSSRAHVDFFFSFPASCRPYRLALDNNKNPSKLRYKTRQPTRLNHVYFRSTAFFPFIFPFSYSSRFVLLLLRGSHTLSFHLVLVPPLCLHPYSFFITGTPGATTTIQNPGGNTHV